MKIECTIRKIQDAQPVGIYKPTALDARKKEVDFRLVYVNGKYNTIYWKDGSSQTVGKKELKTLQSKYSWVTDF